MKRHTRGIVAVVTFLVLLNAWALWRLPSAEDVRQNGPKRQREATRLRQTWAAAETVLLSSQDLPQAVLAIFRDGCTVLPEGSEAIAVNDLSEGQRTDLTAAIIGLLRAHQTGTPNAVISYMRERGKVLDYREKRPYAEKYLAKQPHWTPERLRAASDEDVYVAFQNLDIPAAWSGVLPACSCCQVWTYRGDVDTQKSLPGDDLCLIFGGSFKWEHSFTSALSNSPESRSDAPARELLADVVLVIEHSDDLGNEPAPYLYRFRYNAAAELWQPFIQARATTFEDAPTGVPF